MKSFLCWVVLYTKGGWLSSPRGDLIYGRLKILANGFFLSNPLLSALARETFDPHQICSASYLDIIKAKGCTENSIVSGQ
jgi:hypothetical protein